jgi:hypothetical protein
MVMIRPRDSTAETYMKFLIFTPPIVFVSCALILAGCDSLGLRDPLRSDQVPDAVKAEPRLVATPPDAPSAMSSPAVWPRLGDVPFKPKDFSPKPAYTHYMDELEYHRAEAEAAKKKVEDESPVPPDAESPDVASPTGVLPKAASQDEFLVPPQLPQLRKE